MAAGRDYASAMGAKSTTAKGNAFREALKGVLRAAGFRTAAEAKLGHKNVDVTGVWTREEAD